MLWKTFKYPTGQREEIDYKQLIKRLQAVVKQDNPEIMQLAIQSILEELKEGAI